MTISLHKSTRLKRTGSAGPELFVITEIDCWLILSSGLGTKVGLSRLCEVVSSNLTLTVENQCKFPAAFGFGLMGWSSTGLVHKGVAGVDIQINKYHWLGVLNLNIDQQ